MKVQALCDQHRQVFNSDAYHRKHAVRPELFFPALGQTFQLLSELCDLFQMHVFVIASTKFLKFLRVARHEMAMYMVMNGIRDCSHTTVRSGW